jgi:hypothetical protein
VSEKRRYSGGVARRAEELLDDLGGLDGDDFTGVLPEADSPLLGELADFLGCLVYRVVLAKKKTGRRSEEQRMAAEAVDTTTAFAVRLARYATRQLKQDSGKYIYLRLLHRQERFERSLGLPRVQHRPLWWRGDTFNYKCFLGTALVGCLKLLERCRSFDAEQALMPDEGFEEDPLGNTLINIARLFQDENRGWCAVLAGDIGTTFRLRNDVKLIDVRISQPDQPSEESWGDPADVDLSYNSEAGRIVYRRR